MSRSPLFYPLNRGADADAGGAADLQTDVMRFMAIISLCLVAIFALVQSIPMSPAKTIPEPTVPAVAQEQAAEPIVEPVAEPVVPPPSEIKLTRPAPVKATVNNETVVVQRPQSRPLPQSVPEDLPPAPPLESKPVQKGFTLRFETDQALTRLVEQKAVGLYVITAGKSVRMSIDGDEMSFWPASLPGQFHEMDESTVPEQVITAYRRNNNYQSVDSKWGVTLPGGLSQQLNQYLAEREGGSLIISSSGDLRLEI
jgi:hypothetical protein